jgi:uncharacterized protein
MTVLVASLGRIRNLDPVLVALLFGSGALALLTPDQATRSVTFVIRNLLEVSPFLLASVALAAYAGASGADNLIARAFTGSLPAMIVFAALMGALSPFCSCGVIPIIAALLASGVPLAPVMAFWLSSPLMDPSMFMLTAGTLGLGFAVGKTLAAVGVGLLGGFGAAALMRAGLIGEALRPGVGNGGCAGARVRQPKSVVWAFWREGERRSNFTRGAIKTLVFLGKWLMVAFFLESLMLAYAPADFVAHVVGGKGLGAIVLAALVGIPAYLNGTAALPLVAGLLEQGMSPGAAMAFLIGGGVTSIPAAIAVAAIARPRVLAAYLGFATTGAILAGIGYGLFG